MKKINSKEYIITLTICIIFICVSWFGSDINKIKINSNISANTKNDQEHKENIKKTDSKEKNNTLVEKETSPIKNESSSENSNTSNTNNNSISDSSSGKYKNGEYTGQAVGFKGDVKVKVLIENNNISSVQILENADDPEYFSKAEMLTDIIVKNNSPDVDTISGATFSSNGIINATKNALSNASN